MKSNELITWDNMTKKPCVPLEWEFLKECESGCYAGISAKRRFIEFLHLIRLFPEKPTSILDVAGNLGTARWLQAKFPSSRVTILNNCQRELGDWPYVINSDAMNFATEDKYDLIIIAEVIEHVYNPDGVIACSLFSLKPSGFMVITTPNLACIYNRIFLLFGWSPGNYNASIRYKTGNPFFNTVGDFRITADHKSVFTWKGLSELLTLYGLRIIESRGYDYGQKELLHTMGDRYAKVPLGRLRSLLNRFTPKKLREGMLFLCQPSDNLNLDKIKGGILKERLWEH